MRLGIYGGTFDPVHYGHLLAAEQCREQCGLDEVWFVPAATPPHKQGHSISPGVARAEMLEIARRRQLPVKPHLDLMVASAEDVRLPQAPDGGGLSPPA